MWELLSASASMMHEWLERRRLAEGRAGRVVVGEDGTATFEVNHAGVFNVSASREFATGALTIEAVPGESMNAVLRLEETSQVIAGMVVDEEGHPIAGAQIEIICSKEVKDGDPIPARDPRTNH